MSVNTSVTVPRGWSTPLCHHLDSLRVNPPNDTEPAPSYAAAMQSPTTGKEQTMKTT